MGSNNTEELIKIGNAFYNWVKLRVNATAHAQQIDNSDSNHDVRAQQNNHCTENT